MDDLVTRVQQQLSPEIPVQHCAAWAKYTLMHPESYYWAVVGKAGCIVKVYDQSDPPWKKVAQEVCWWGSGRDAVRSLHRGMDWARLQGAELFGYALAPDYLTTKWRRL